jgi:BirA family transcriptional regulator, biotin operon repressor / biotin---[acetyl-CoA-carboxylase] ligase
MTPDAEWQLDTRHIGRRVLVYNRLDSTNSLAASFAHDESNNGFVILAREQTAGRGQHGRQWECPPNMGVLMSVLIFPPPSLRQPAVLTAWAAVSVCEAISSITGLQAKIRWPNDIYVQGRKVCGILIEQSKGTVVGIGLNVNQPAEVFTAHGLTLGTSLLLLTNKQHDCDGAARHIIVNLDREYERLCQGDCYTLETCWRERIGLIGKDVIIECADSLYEGRLVDVTFQRLELDQREVGTTLLLPEMVKHLTGR